MRCFFVCFGGACNCKHRKRRHLLNATPTEAPRNEVAEALQLVVTKASAKPTTESKEKLEKALSCNTKKKVTFDSNVKTNEDLASEQDLDNNLVKTNENKEIDNLEQKNEKKESDDDLVESKSNENKGSENKKETPKVPNHRYQNCAATTREDDYDEDLGSNEKLLLAQEESSESLFSLSIGSRKQVCEVEFGEKEVNSPMTKCGGGSSNQQHETRDRRSQYLHSVLNPVENLTQWKMVKARVTTPPPPLKYQDKENINFCSKLKEAVDGEIAVDTSLSSWLLASEATPMSENRSSISDGDKQVLGSLTVEEVKESYARKSRSPEEPKVGTIGNYWSVIQGRLL